jgi:hypothetical protein
VAVAAQRVVVPVAVVVKNRTEPLASLLLS